MNGTIVIYVGSLMPIGWGIAHLFPTRNVVSAFGDITPDNKRIITMEWITEGIALIFIGVLVAVATYMDRRSLVSQGVYWTSFTVLNVLSVVSLFTGFRNSFIAFKLCPLIFSSAAALIIIGAYWD
ncbi:MAG: hypothetical protein ACHQQQ_06865 [Bacteroidota bacterium]